MTKLYKQHNMTYFIKFNSVKIKLDKEKSLYLNHKSYALVKLVKKIDLSSIDA